MSNVYEYACFLKQNFHPQLIIPELATKLGLEESIVLQQIHYWLEKSGKSIGGGVWIYNTFEQWHQQFIYWSISKIKRIFYSLEKAGFIISKKMNVRKSNHTKWYALNYEKLSSLMVELLPKRAPKEKKITQIKNELSLCQLDTIIIGNTNTNYSNNLSRNEVKIDNQVEQPDKNQIKSQIDYSIFSKEACDRMLTTWNEIFIKTNKPIVLTKGRGEKLYNLWKEVFAEDIEKWRSFCISVNSSKFLMGEKKNGFKAYFDWIISGDTVNRIMAGEFDIGDRVPDIKQAEIKQQAEKAKIDFGLRQEEQRQQREAEKKQLEIETLSEKLAREELAKIEADWTDDNLSEAKQAFEVFIEKEANNAENNGYVYLQMVKNTFIKERWKTPFVDLAFEEFKLNKFLKKKYEDFMEQAKNLLVTDLNYSIN